MRRMKILRICFIGYGLVMISAIFFVFIPNAGMVWIGRNLDLPHFEVTTIFEYMARGMSSLCFLFGVFLFYVGLHLREYAKLVRLLGWLMLLTFPGVLFIHLQLLTPIWWKVGDVTGVLLLCLMCFATPDPD